MPRTILPTDQDTLMLAFGDRVVRLTNLRKVFWKEAGLTKRDLIQYYADVSPYLLPHLADRGVTMKRFPNGAAGAFFYMKHAPASRPPWVKVCPIPHKEVIDFVMVSDLPSLLWVINLGCIDLHPWYGRCDDPDRPDVLHFDLDPGPGAEFAHVCEAALRVREMLDALTMPSFVKTSGSKGLHVYVPITRDPLQKEVWTVAKALAQDLASRHPRLITAEYRIAKRPHGRVLVDYNQNAWGRSLASVYSVRPTPRASVSTPVTWEELERGITIDMFRIDNVPQRLHERGDRWKKVLGNARFDLRPFISTLVRLTPSRRVRSAA